MTFAQQPTDEFQSAPAPKSGRYRDSEYDGTPLDSFNPRPLRRAGDTEPALRTLPPQLVSIRARSEERAIHAQRRVELRARSFNPRPLRRAGDTSRHTHSPYLLGVSIRARSEERAILTMTFLVHTADRFQSAPAPKSGRYVERRKMIPTMTRFNPRPLRRAGDTNSTNVFSAP